MSIYSPQTLNDVRRSLEARRVLDLIDYRTDTIQEVDGNIRCFCPIHQEGVFRTLTVEPDTGVYRCSYSLCSGSEGGDLIDLYARYAQMEYDEAVLALVEKLDIDVELPPTAVFLDKSLERAAAFLKAGDIEDARRGFEKIISIQPERLEAWQGSLAVAEKLDDADLALQARREIARLLEKADRYDEALTCCVDILEQRPDDEEAMRASARCHLGLGDQNEALSVYMRLCDAFESQGQFDRAIGVYHEIERLDLDIIDIFPHIISAMVASDRTEDAVDETLGKARSLIEAEDWDKALECLRYVFETDPLRDDVRRLFIETAASAGLNDARLDAATDVLEQLTERHSLNDAFEMMQLLKASAPRDPRVMALAADILNARGDDDAAMQARLQVIDHLTERGAELQAREELEVLRKEQPDFIPVLTRLGRVYRLSGDVDHAVETFERVATLMERSGAAEDALPVLQSIAELAPDDTDLRLRMIRLALMANETARAADMIWELLDAFAEGREFEQALNLIEQYGLLLPEQGRLLRLKSNCFLELDRRGESQQAMVEACKAFSHEDRPEEGYQLVREYLNRHPHDTSMLDMMADLGDRARTSPGRGSTVRETLIQNVEAGNTSGALEALRHLIESAPNDVETLEKLLPRVIERGMSPLVAKFYRRLVEVHSQRGASAKAVECAAQWLSHSPDETTLSEALDIARQSNRVGPMAAALLDWGRARAVAGELNAAIDAFESLTRELPNDGNLREHFLLLLGENSDQEGVAERAEDAVRQWAQSDSSLRAEDFCREREREEPDSLYWSRLLLVALREMNQTEAALAQCVNVYERQGDNVNWSDVVGELSDLLDDHPADPGLLRLLARGCHELGHLTASTSYLLRLASVLKENGDPQESEKVLREAVERAPDNPAAHAALISFLADVGREGETIEARLTLARLLEQHGAREHALTELRWITAQQPDHVEAKGLLKEMEEKSRSVVEAMKEFETLASGATPRVVSLTPEPETTAPEPVSGASRSVVDNDSVAEHRLEVVEEYSFDHFVVGKPNNFAHATAMAVARAPADQYNPLFLYSDVGMGKTHLINAIANYLRQEQPDMDIVYVSADDFASSLVEAIAGNRARQFCDTYKRAGVLLMDDIQFLVGKEQAQEEFFNIFNSLYQAKRQIVISSDRPPKELDLLHKRLRSRFMAGVVVDIQPIDLETRAAILTHERETMGLTETFPVAIIQLIAERVDTNVRELKGAFKQFIAYASAYGQDPTAKMAKETLERMGY